MVPWWLLPIAWVVGLLVGSRLTSVVTEHRCTRIRTYGLTTYTHRSRPPLQTTSAVRCILEHGHESPHCVRLNEGQPNERLDWFEDELNTKSAADVEAGDQQGPVG